MSSELLLKNGWATGLPQEGEPLGIVWADASVSTLEIPMVVPRAMKITVRMMPLNCPGCSPQAAKVTLNGRPIAELDLSRPGFRDYTFEAPTDAWRYGQNLLSFAWDRLTAPAEIDRSLKALSKLAAAVVKVDLDPISGSARADQRAVTLADDRFVVSGDEAAQLYLRIPPRARLEGNVGRDDGSSSFGAAGTVRISIGIDGQDEEVLFLQGLAGLSHRSFPFAIDLGRFGGRVARLSLRLGSAQAGEAIRAAFSGLRLCNAAQEVVDGDDAFGIYRGQPVDVTPPTRRAKEPDVIVYIMDALRARTLGCYGALEIASPFLDRLSREGALLTHANSQASNTPPNVKSLLTGKYLPYTGKSPLRPGDKSLTEALKDAGYATAALATSPWPAALAALRGFDVHPDDLYTHSVENWWNLKETPPKYYAREMFERFRSWAPEQSGHPIFLYAHSLHPHNPYAPPPPWSTLDQPSKLWDFNGNSRFLLDIQYGRLFPDQKQLDELRRLYRLDVLCNDYEIARTGALMRQLGRWDDSIFLFIADHGDELYEHHGIMHGFTSYSELIEIPFLLRAPSMVPAGWLATDPHETIDAAPTILALAGLPPLPDADGTPIRFVPSDASRAPRRTYSSCSGIPGIYTVMDRGWKYVYAPRDGTMVGIGEGASRVKDRFYLYDLIGDAEEQKNIVDTHPILAHYMHRAINSWLRATGDTPAPQKDLPPETQSILQSLGYLDAGAPKPGGPATPPGAPGAEEPPGGSNR